MVSLRMCSVKMNTPRSGFWIAAPFMNDIAVSKDRVIKLLKGLNPSKALGPDELHPSPKGASNGVRSGVTVYLAPRGASCPGLSYPPPWLSSPPGGQAVQAGLSCPPPIQRQ